ncbi:hypothetical protein K474DRAFT_1601633 [Panus rudis PR-1116 ss-1]|nr:hypothetical protein K474DRAFT_1601633 [Panus rudis PR-1116 ss-1]
MTVRAPEEQIERIVDALCRAFQTDAVMKSMTGGDPATLALFFRITIHKALATGECYVALAGDTICGVSAWLPPGCDWTIQDDATFASKLKRDLQEWYRDHYSTKYQDLYRSSFPSNPKMRERSWSLKLLAVVPQSRRKGVGKALMNIICKKADSRSETMVAEATDPYLVKFFQSVGFKYCAVKNVSCTSSPGFPLWCMVRYPRLGISGG